MRRRGVSRLMGGVSREETPRDSTHEWSGRSGLETPPRDSSHEWSGRSLETHGRSLKESSLDAAPRSVETHGRSLEGRDSSRPPTDS